MTNADAAELAKFDELASRWWDRGGEFKALHDINELRVDYIAKRTGTGLAGSRVLDVGCGGGILSEGLARRGAFVTGIDLAEQVLRVARAHAADASVRVDYRLTSIEDLADELDASGDPGAERFDVVTCLEVLEHVPDPDSIVAAAAKLVRPGGHLVLSTIHRQLKAFLLAIIGGEYLTNMVPRGTHDYDKLIRPSELSRSLRAHGFDVRDVTGMSYNPVTGRYSLGRDVDVNYFVHAVLPDAAR